MRDAVACSECDRKLIHYNLPIITFKTRDGQSYCTRLVEGGCPHRSPHNTKLLLLEKPR